MSHSESPVDPREPAGPASAHPRASRLRSTITSSLFALAAFALLAWVMQRNGGVRVVLDVVHHLRWTWPLLFVPYGLGALAIVLTYRACLPEGGRAVPFGTLVHIERAGSALNAFLPLGDSSGNIAKVALLRHWYTSEQIVAAGVWSSLGTGIGNAVAALGPLVGAAMGVVPWWLAGVLAAVNFVLAVPASIVLLLVRRGLARRAAHWITRLPFAFVRHRAGGIVAWSEGLDRHVASAVHERSDHFIRMVGYKVLYQVTRVAHIWLVIELLGFEGGFACALAYNAMSRPVQQLLVFVPGRLGVTEALSASFFAAFGWPASSGLAVALVLRFNFVVNLFFSGTALAGTHALARRYPPRSTAELEAEAVRRA